MPIISNQLQTTLNNITNKYECIKPDPPSTPLSLGDEIYYIYDTLCQQKVDLINDVYVAKYLFNKPNIFDHEPDVNDSRDDNIYMIRLPIGYDQIIHDLANRIELTTEIFLLKCKQYYNRYKTNHHLYKNIVKYTRSNNQQKYVNKIFEILNDDCKWTSCIRWWNFIVSNPLNTNKIKLDTDISCDILVISTYKSKLDIVSIDIGSTMCSTKQLYLYNLNIHYYRDNQLKISSLLKYLKSISTSIKYHSYGHTSEPLNRSIMSDLHKSYKKNHNTARYIYLPAKPVYNDLDDEYYNDLDLQSYNIDTTNTNVYNVDRDIMDEVIANTLSESDINRPKKFIKISNYAIELV